MKIGLLTSCFLASFTIISMGAANAIGLPNVQSVTGSSTSSAKSEKTAANEAYKKEYQAKINAQKKELDDVIAYDKQARLSLAKVILTDEQNNEISKLNGEEQDAKLNEYLVATLSNETFPVTYAEWDETQKGNYLGAITKIEITNNKYKNVSNKLTAPLKAIVDGNVSAISAKDELKNAGAMILGIKKDLGANSDVRKAVHKANKTINKANKEAGSTDAISIVVPDSERVVYPKEGVIGSVNAQLEDTNYKVKKASSTIIDILVDQETKATNDAISKNPDLSDTEKHAEIIKNTNNSILTGLENGQLQKRMDSLSDADKKKYQEAAQVIFEAGAEYGAVSVSCTKLGFNISKNPILAAPLVFEVGALKDTASLAKSSASDLTKLVSQVKKVNKACGITIEKPEVAGNVENSAAGKIKNVGFKNLKNNR